MLQKNDTTLPYHAFGMEMPGRKWTASNYRYSHNGHEKEEEIFSGANSAEFWMYDSRIGRRWEMDPIVKSWESPYACFYGNPIYFADPLGLDGDGDKNKAGGDGGKGGAKGSAGDKGEGNKTQTDFLKEHPDYKSDGKGGVVWGGGSNGGTTSGSSNSGGNTNSGGSNTSGGGSSGGTNTGGGSAESGFN